MDAHDLKNKSYSTPVILRRVCLSSFFLLWSLWGADDSITAGRIFLCILLLCVLGISIYYLSIGLSANAGRIRMINRYYPRLFPENPELEEGANSNTRQLTFLILGSMFAPVFVGLPFLVIGIRSYKKKWHKIDILTETIPAIQIDVKKLPPEALKETCACILFQDKLPDMTRASILKLRASLEILADAPKRYPNAQKGLEDAAPTCLIPMQTQLHHYLNALQTDEDQQWMSPVEAALPGYEQLIEALYARLTADEPGARAEDLNFLNRVKAEADG